MNSESKYIDFLNTLPESEEKEEMIQYLKKQIKFKTQTQHYKDKMNVLLSFVKFLKTICNNTNINIYGSFTRNLFEKIFMDSSITGYGDPINHDVDMIIYNNKHDFNSDIINFSDFISLLRIVANNHTYDFNFAGFKIIDVLETTLTHANVHDESGLNKTFLIDVPHYVIILIKDSFKIKIDMLAYKNDSSMNEWQNEFNINSLSLSNNGITAKNEHSDSYGMFETMYSIINKTAICNLPFNTLLMDFTWKTRTEKVKIFNQIIWFFTNRMKILSLGYTDIYSDNQFFDYVVEKEEDCILSGNSAPYIKIKLSCDHYISIMGLAGLVNIRGSEWTEAIKCPYCRHDLMLQLIDKTPEKIKIPEQPRKEIVELDSYEITDELFSSENASYISNLLKNQQLPNIESDRIGAESVEPITRTIEPSPRRTHTLIGRTRTRDEYRGLFN